jgi:hypothetical protein
MEEDGEVLPPAKSTARRQGAPPEESAPDRWDEAGQASSLEVKEAASWPWDRASRVRAAFREERTIMRVRKVMASVSALCGFGVLAGCGGSPNEGSPQPEKVAESTSALQAGFWTENCAANDDAFIVQAHNLGKVVAGTDAYAQCLRGGPSGTPVPGKLGYIPCSSDGEQGMDWLIGATRSYNATQVECKELPGTTLGETTYWDTHGYYYYDTEEISVDTTFLHQNITAWAGGNVLGPLAEAGVIWHEVMHVHGYEHGDNSDADDAAEDCGHSGDGWVWTLNSGPYAVEGCMTQVGATLVAATAEAMHKRRPLPATERALYQAMMNGTMTYGALRAAVARNGFIGSATPIAIPSATSDELYQGPNDLSTVDNDWYVFTLPTQTVVHAWITTSDGSLPAATLQGPLAESPAIDFYGPAGATALLDQGAIYIHAFARTGPFTLHVEEATPTAPIGCSVSTTCGQYATVSCQTPAFPRETDVESSTDGVNWQRVTLGGPSGASFLLPPGGVWPSYRLCTLAMLSDARACTPIDFSQATGSCVTSGGGDVPYNPSPNPKRHLIE